MSVSPWLKSNSIELFAAALTGVRYSPIHTYRTELVASLVPLEPCRPEASDVVLTLPVSVGTLGCTGIVLAWVRLQG
jgi:hypothetical protein